MQVLPLRPQPSTITTATGHGCDYAIKQMEQTVQRAEKMKLDPPLLVFKPTVPSERTLLVITMWCVIATCVLTVVHLWIYHV